MSTHNILISLANVISTVLLGALLFFTIIGGFGFRFAIAGQLTFLIAAATVASKVPSKVQNNEARPPALAGTPIPEVRGDREYDLILK